MMKITGLSQLFKWENLHNWWLTKYFFAPLYVCTKPVLSYWGILVVIDNNTLYGLKLYIFILCQQSL